MGDIICRRLKTKSLKTQDQFTILATLSNTPLYGKSSDPRNTKCSRVWGSPGVRGFISYISADDMNETSKLPTQHLRTLPSSVWHSVGTTNIAFTSGPSTCAITTCLQVFWSGQAQSRNRKVDDLQILNLHPRCARSVDFNRNMADRKFTCEIPSFSWSDVTVRHWRRFFVELLLFFFHGLVGSR